MLNKTLLAGLAATLLAGTALAQTTAPTQPAGQGQVMTQMPQDLMRGSSLMGVDVYGTDNQKIGDVDEVLVDRQGKIHGIVVGVGGFLGIGQKDVAIPFDQVQWMSNREVQASSNASAGNSTGASTSTGGTNTAGGVTTPGPVATGTDQPSTTGTTAAPGTAGTTGTTTTSGSTGSASGSGSSDENAPARAMVKMTKADLQNAPEFRYSANAGGNGNTSAPAGANRPATAPQ